MTKKQEEKLMADIKREADRARAQANKDDEAVVVNACYEHVFFKKWAKDNLLERYGESHWLSNGTLMTKLSDTYLRKLVEAGVLEVVPGGWRYKAK